MVEPAAIICDYSRSGPARWSGPGHVSSSGPASRPNRCSTASRRGRGDAGRATGAAVMGADPPGARDPAAAVMAAAEPEREAEMVADATATIGTDRYHVDLQAGRRAGRRRAGRPRRGRYRPVAVRAAAVRPRRVHHHHLADVRRPQAVALEGVDVQLVYTVKDRASRWIDRRITLRGPGRRPAPGWPRSPRRRRSPGRCGSAPRSARRSGLTGDQPRRSEHEDRDVEVVEAMTERMVVVGGDAAGMSAASQAKRLAGDKLEVLAFERGPAPTRPAASLLGGRRRR